MMQKKIPLGFLLLNLVMLFLSPQAIALSEPYDHSVWDQFLKEFVNDSGEINMKGVLREPKLLEAYLEKIQSTDQREVGKWPREEQLAFWLNAYHAGVVDLLRKHYPFEKGIQEISGVWESEILKIGESALSLNRIREDILLGQFRDEKIHTALYCGAVSCPRLRNEAFKGPKVEGQLFMAAGDFVNSASFNEIIPGKKKIRVSKIFKWYGEDFKLDFGSFGNERGIDDIQYATLSFLAHYHKNPDVIDYLESGNYKVKYQKFDWSFNEWKVPAEGPVSATAA